MTTFPEPQALTSVADFHRAFKVPVVQDGPCIPPQKRAQLRVALLQEELNELKAAIEAGDLVECADALADLQYVLSGAVLEFGMQGRFKALFDEVHRSNMTKACATRAEAEKTVAHYRDKTGVEGTIEARQEGAGFLVFRTEDQKVLKSVNYSPASLRPVLCGSLVEQLCQTASPARPANHATLQGIESGAKRPRQGNRVAEVDASESDKRPRCGSVHAKAPADAIVVVGPSGVGKSCLVDKLIAEYPGQFGYSVSHTTRAARPGEQDGVDYHFVSVEAMKRDIDARKFIEHAEVHGNFYGTSYEAVEQVVAAGKICLLIIDVQGAESVKRAPLDARSVYVFVSPPDEEELERRLRCRGTESEEKVQKRMQNARKELAYLERPDFWNTTLVNAELEACYGKFRSFVQESVGRDRLVQSVNAKQDPVEKNKRSLAADGKCYFSYAQIASAVHRAVPEVEAFAPDVFVAIGGGGFIPARMLRTEVKKPILAVSLELYDDATNTANATVLRKQWFDETPGTFGALVRGKRVLIVDEVDDTRATLQYAVAELKKLNEPAAIGVLVVHNKLKDKKGVLPDDVTYICGENVPNAWNCYPWDAAAYGRDVYAHEELARQYVGGIGEEVRDGGA